MKKGVLAAGALAAVGAAGAAVLRRRQEAGRSVPPDGAARVVILGAGFGGVAAAKELAARSAEPPLDVLLVDRYNYHLFTPILYQVATGGVGPDNIAHPLRPVARKEGFRFQESQVQRIDTASRCVYTDDGAIPYDYLVVALGATTNFFGMNEIGEHALTLKTLGDGIRIRNRILDAFERAATETDPAERRRLLTFVVVGAGATGVELVTSIRDLISRVLLRDYPSLADDEPRVLLIEAMDKVLPAVNPQLAAAAVRTMERKGVLILTNTPVSGVDEAGVHLKSGEVIPSATVVWAAGVRANELVGSLHGEKGRDGRVAVDEYLQLPSAANVYVIGDSAMYTMPGEARPLPPNAPIAIAQGKTAARNILQQLRGEPLERLQYEPQGELVSLGRSNAVADLRGVRLTGRLGWLAWRLVYVSKLMGAKNRLGVLLDWTFNLFNKRETSKLEVR